MPLPSDVFELLRKEQLRQGDQFVPDLTEYPAKLGRFADLLTYHSASVLQGFVFVYCNDKASRQSYIPLIAVSPDARGKGVGQFLLASALALARSRGFSACRLEVFKSNHAARKLYESAGFAVQEDRGEKLLLGVALNSAGC
jgi:ribosomal protein S18 acetylase RimI-like enzyme